MNQKLRAGILGGTGFVGQRLVTLLADHPDFEISVIAASEKSAGKTYGQAVEGRWKMESPLPENAKSFLVRNIDQVDEISRDVDFVFCAVDMPKAEIQAIEERYARTETPVVSNNSAHRMTPDVPAMIPELNPQHLAVIADQRRRLGTKKGFIVAKPNCSIQCYVPPIHALLEFQPTQILACTYQAISGAGKRFSDWPEMVDNCIPFIKGEEQKSEEEPLKIWGQVVNGQIVHAASPLITTQCIRVPVTEGHLAAVFVSFAKKPDMDTILERWQSFRGRPQELNLHSAPQQFITYFAEDNRPQTREDRDLEKGMAVSVGRLRPDTLFDYKFVCLSHNTLRGAAGGSVLTAELLKAEGYLTRK